MVAKQLNAKQLARAHQLHIQLGVVSFLSQTKVPERLEAILNLSTEQQRALDENRNGVKDGERTAAHYEATMQVLTKDQLAELLEAYGPPSKLFPPVRQYLGDPPRSVPVPASK